MKQNVLNNKPNEILNLFETNNICIMYKKKWYNKKGGKREKY